MAFARKVYLDYAASTPISIEAIQAMIEYSNLDYANPSSLHSQGRNAKIALENLRKQAAKILCCDDKEIIFTGSGTEANNLAIQGVALANQKYGKHIIVSAIEHPSILEPAKILKDLGFEISIAPVNKYGEILINELKKLIRSDTILVSIMYANNEIGTIQPITKLTKTVKKLRKNSIFPVFHTDACQAVGALSINVDTLGVDMMSLNGSKIYGPKGVGFLYKKREIQLQPIISGGHQEQGLRAGTENLPAIAGFVRSLETTEHRRLVESQRLTELRNYFIANLKEKIPNIIFNGHPYRRLPNNIHVSFPAIEGESILLMLDDFGISVSTGSACSSQDLKPSHVLLAIGQDENLIHGSIRFSLGRSTTKNDLDYVLEVLPKIVNRLSKISAIGV